MLFHILWSNWEAETCQLSTRPRLDALCETGMGSLSTESTVPTCCLSQTSTRTANVSTHSVELLLLLLLRVTFSPPWLCPSHRPLEGGAWGPGGGRKPMVNHLEAVAQSDHLCFCLPWCASLHTSWRAFSLLPCEDDSGTNQSSGFIFSGKGRGEDPLHLCGEGQIVARG